jgi:glutathione S-transferase
MKLYTDIGGNAPSPRRVRIFIAEKNLEIPCEELKLHDENRSDAFRKKNKFRTLPVLELDDGTCIAESMAICRYLEELHPEPDLLGASPLERAHIEMWTRRMEMALYIPIDMSGDSFPSEMATLMRDGAHRTMRFLDRELATRPFIAGDRYTMADIFAQGALDFGIAHVGYTLPEEHRALADWHARVSARPSASA